MKQAVTFHLPVHKATNDPAIVEVGDTVTLGITNDGGAMTTQDVVLTAVSDGGKTIQWDAGTTGNLGTRHVIRPHAKHSYHCAGVDDWQAVLTEEGDSDTDPAEVISLTINGVVYAVEVVEAAAADGITETFRAELVAKLQELVGPNGYVTGVVAGVAGAQTLTIKIAGTTHVPSTWSLGGLTAAAWTNP
jgi:hypothetical protein